MVLLGCMVRCRPVANQHLAAQCRHGLVVNRHPGSAVHGRWLPMGLRVGDARFIVVWTYRNRASLHAGLEVASSSCMSNETSDTTKM